MLTFNLGNHVLLPSIAKSAGSFCSGWQNPLVASFEIANFLWSFNSFFAFDHGNYWSFCSRSRVSVGSFALDAEIRWSPCSTSQNLTGPYALDPEIRLSLCFFIENFL
jgi:hypothetical protein